MKKLLLFTVGLCILVTSLNAQQKKTYGYPNTGKSIFNVTVPTSTWEVTNKENLLSFVPIEKGEKGRLIAMMWTSTYSGSEDDINKIIDDGNSVLNTLLEDHEWNEKTEEFKINDIDFVAMDGWGNYKNDDGSKDEMMMSIMIFFPDSSNVGILLFIATNSAYDKYSNELIEIIQTISSPTKK